jgi:hypothetical protein
MAVFSYDSRIDSEIGEVSVSPLGITASNSVVFNYTTESKEPYSEVDYNLISVLENLFVDCGFIANTIEVVVDNRFISQDFSDSILKPSGSSESIPVRSYAGDGVIKVQEYKDKSTFIWVGNGTLFEIGGDITRIVAPGITGPPIGSSTTKIYNTNISLEFVGESSNSKKSVFDKNLNVTNDLFVSKDYGSLEAYQNSIDLGSVEEFNIFDYENYGLVIYDQIYGSIKITNDANNNSRTSVYTGYGSVSTYGNADVLFFRSRQTDTSIALFTVFGEASVTTNLPAVVNSYTSSGTLFSIGTNVEKIRYDYNQSSIVVVSGDDYEYITSSGISVDYGSVIYDNTSAFNYGTVEHITTAYPYQGLFSVTGRSDYSKINTFVGFGLFSAYGGYSRSIFVSARTIDVSTNFSTISGESYSKFVASFAGSGSLIESNTSINYHTYSYNNSSVSTFTSTDFGNIISAADNIDYGLVINQSDSEYNNGFIISRDNVYPYGSLYATGSVRIGISNKFTTTGSIAISGTATTAFTEPFTQIYPERDYGLFSVTGSAITSPVRSIKSSGGLFTLNSSTSSRLYNYGIDCVDLYSTDNYGSITASGITVDYGYVANPPEGIKYNYGLIVNNQDTYAYSGSVVISGSSSVSFFRKPGYVGSGSLFVFKGATTTTLSSERTDTKTSLFNVYGSANSALSRKVIISGSLYENGTVNNSSVYSYNSSSTTTFTSSNYGLVSNSVDTSSNYGTINTTSNDGDVNYGLVIYGSNQYPYGTLTISGSYANQKRSFAYFSSGSINISGSASTTPSAETPRRFIFRDTTLYSVSGNSTLKSTKYSVGSGTLFNVNGHSGAVAFNYNRSSIKPFDNSDYGLITVSGTLINYGAVGNFGDAFFNYGSIEDRTIYYPFGLINISGSQLQSFAKGSYVASGAISAISGSASSEVFKAKQIAESTDLYTISGSANILSVNKFASTGSLFTASGSANSAAYSYNTSSTTTFSTNDFGTITTSGSTVNYGSIVVGSDIGIDYGYVIDRTNNYPFGNLNLNGTYKTTRTFGFAGSGSANIRGAAGVISTQPFVQIYVEKDYGLYAVSGSATTSAAPKYKSSGSLFSVGGSASSITYAYTLGSIEYFSTLDLGTVNTTGTSSDYGLITTGSDAKLDYGSIIVTQTEFPYKGKVFVTGSATTQKYNVYTQVGSGTLNVISGFANAIYQGKKTLEPTDLFNISGTPYVTRTNKFFGSGSLYVGNAYPKDIDLIITDDYIVDSDYEIKQAPTSTETYSYNSSSTTTYSTTDIGTITSSGVIDDYGYITIGSDREFNYGYLIDTGIKYPYGLFNISGSYQTSNRSFAHKSSGSINISGSSTTRLAEPTPQIYTERDYGLYSVSGSAAPTRTFTSRTTGSLFTLNGSAPSVTYNYSSIAVEYTSVIDYGSVATTGNTINNGFITNPVDVYTDYVSVTIGEKATRFGSINTFGSSVSLKVFTPVASGSLFSTKGAASSTFRPVDTDTVLFTISGSATNVLCAFGYTSSGSLFTIGDHTERVTYNYHIDSVNLYEKIDYESITSSGSSQDYGYIGANENTASPINYGYIDVAESVRAYGGSIKISGTPKINFIPLLIYNGSGQIKVSGNVSTITILTAKARPESTDLYNVSGSADVSVTRPTFTETAAFSTFSGAAEAVAKVYNQFSINQFTEIDYEFITGSGSTINYGLISDSTNSIFDYGYIFDTQTVLPYGNIKIVGPVSNYKFAPNFAYSSTGSLFAASGSADTRAFAQTQDNETRLFNIYGSSLTTPVTSYISSGSLFNIGSKIESATYAYNPSSILTFTNSDYGYVASAADTTFDYGLVSESSVGDINLGYIVNGQTLYPHGRFTLVGQSSVEFYRRPSYAGSGSLFEYSGSAETRSFSEGKDSQTKLFNVYGSANTIFSRPYITTGSLFNIGSKFESRTYVYDQSSITSFSSSNYEFINSIANVYNDYGLISESSVGDINFGYITETGITYPFGTIKIANASAQKTTAIYRGSGSLFTFRSLTESSVKTTQTETSLFIISGASSNIRTFGYAGTGSLFNIGTKVEKATYSYNESSVTTFSYGNYEYITSVADTTIDSGLISESSVGDINLGYITQTGIVYPYGKFAISGSASTTAPAIYSGVGSLFTIGGSAQATAKSLRAETSLFIISGASSNIRTFGYAGTGSLFDIGTKIESRTYVYDSSAIIEFNTLNYEDIGEGPTVFENYGNIGEGSSAYFNYGSVADTDIVYPYGGFNITGGSVETFAPILAWRGSGTINVTGSVYIVFNLSAKPKPTSDDTINISGTSRCLFSLGHVGSGSVFNIGKKIEKATYSYNTSSIVPYGTADYQFISSAPDLSSDYGTVTEPGYGVTDFGSIQNLDYAYPFGTLKVSNTVTQKATRVYRGSGSLFGIGGESNAYSRIARSETQLFVVSGNLKESFSKGNYAGSGSLFTFRSLTESSAVNPPATGLFRISGIAKERATDSWIGTGSITLQTGIYPEYLYYRPTPRYVTVSGTSYISGSASTEYHATYTNVGSGVIYNSGVASTPRTRPFIGAGVEFISGKLKESFSKGNYAGSGSLFTFNSLTESSTKVLPSETRLYTTSGQATTTRSEAYQGTGSLFTSKGIAESFAYSVPSEIQLFKVSGVATTLHTNNFVGSGSLFTFKSAAESTTAIIPTETQLFKVSGIATTSYNTVYTSSVGGTEFISGAATDVKFVPSFAGSGSLFTFNGLTESSTRTVPSETRLYRIFGTATTIRSGSYVASGTEFISSNAATSNTIIYSGSGSLFTFKSATESKTDVSTSTVLFKINGSVGESFIRTTYHGSGKVSLLRGAAESSTVRVPPETQLFRITGVSTQSTTKGNYTSSGSEFISGADTESTRKIYVASGSLFTFKSATESSSFSPVSEITDLKISGSAKTTRTESYQGTGTEFVYNSASISRTYPTYNGSGSEFISGAANQRAISSYSGNGNITEFGGSAQSTFTAIPPETLLYRISGTATTSFNSVYTTETSGQFSYTGNADLLRRQAFTGSGSLFALNSATITQRVVIVVETNLFRISGGERNSYSRISIFEGGQINTSGKSTDEKVSFTPARIFGTII